MIIDRILCVEGSEMNFYSLNFQNFKLSDRRFLNGFGYGKELSDSIRDYIHPSFADGMLHVDYSTGEKHAYLWYKRRLDGTISLGDTANGTMCNFKDGLYYPVDKFDTKYYVLLEGKYEVPIGGTKEELVEGWYVPNTAEYDLRLYTGKVYYTYPAVKEPISTKMHLYYEFWRNSFIPVREDPDIIPGKRYYTRVSHHVTSSDYTNYKVLDIAKYVKDHSNTWRSECDAAGICDIEHPDGYLVDLPLVPPARCWTTEISQTHDETYSTYWLSVYDKRSLRIINPRAEQYAHVFENTTVFNNHRTDIVIKSAGNVNDPISTITSDGASYYKYNSTYGYIELKVDDLTTYFEKVDPTTTTYPMTYKVKLNAQVYVKDIDNNSMSFSFDKFIVRHNYTLPFVNGFACYPETAQQFLKACNSSQYNAAPSDRNRGCVLVNFEPVGGCSFVRLEGATGTASEFLIPSGTTYDPKNQTMFVVLDGRLLLPEDFTIMDNHIFIDLVKIGVVPELDRKICVGEHIADDSRMVETCGDRDFLKKPNSFLVIVNSPNFQLIRHAPWFKAEESVLKQGGNSYAALDKNQFDKCARGLLYDTTSKSVIEYAREEHTATSYAEEIDGFQPTNVIDYRTSTVTVSAEKPLVILAGSVDNLMSAKAVLFDNPSNIAHDDVIMWPNWVILDFIFRG